MSCGYPPDWFAEPVDDYLKCGICSKVLRSPRVTTCGHVYCKQCILPWIEQYGVCPNRCGELDSRQLSKAVHFEKRIISGLLTKCKYSDFGCRAQIPLADKHRHEKSCVFRGGNGSERFTRWLKSSSPPKQSAYQLQQLPTTNVSSKSAPTAMESVDSGMVSFIVSVCSELSID